MKLQPVSSVQPAKKLSSSYWERFWRQSRSFFFRALLLIKDTASPLWECAQAVMFCFFRMLTHFLPQLVVLRMEAALHYLQLFFKETQESSLQKKHLHEKIDIEERFKAHRRSIIERAQRVEKENQKIEENVVQLAKEKQRNEEENRQLEVEIAGLDEERRQEEERQKKLLQEISKIKEALKNLGEGCPRKQHTDIFHETPFLPYRKPY